MPPDLSQGRGSLAASTDDSSPPFHPAISSQPLPFASPAPLRFPFEFIIAQECLFLLFSCVSFFSRLACAPFLSVSPELFYPDSKILSAVQCPLTSLSWPPRNLHHFFALIVRIAHCLFWRPLSSLSDCGLGLYSVTLTGPIISLLSAPALTSPSLPRSLHTHHYLYVAVGGLARNWVRMGPTRFGGQLYQSMKIVREVREEGTCG